MEDIKTAIDSAWNAYRERFGTDAKLEEGDQVAVVMNNCVLVISLQDATLKYDFIGGKSLQVDHTLRIYESEGK
jgi:hypothetical protein